MHLNGRHGIVIFLIDEKRRALKHFKRIFLEYIELKRENTSFICVPKPRKSHGYSNL